MTKIGKITPEKINVEVGGRCGFAQKPRFAQKVTTGAGFVLSFYM